MRYVCWIILILALLNFGCAKRTDGFSPSERPVVSPEIPSTDSGATGESLMNYAVMTEEGGWKISLNHTNAIQQQVLVNGWEVEVVQD